MFYEPYKPKKKRRRGCLVRLFHFALLMSCAFILLSLFTGGWLDKAIEAVHPSAYSVNNGLPADWTHVLLLGADAAKGGASRSDSMLIASISATGSVKLTSIMRDTLVPIEGHGKQKINAAYAFGGAELAMKTVNQAFDLNIRRYAVIDFAGFAGLIDAVGGIDVDVSKAEMEAINTNFNPSSKKGRLTEYGAGVHLNGAQALRFSRIRKLDSDYNRASRQRTVMEALMRKVRGGANPIQLVQLAQAGFSAIQTNMNPLELAALGVRALMGGAQIEQFRVPVDGTYESGTKDGVWSIRADLQTNARKLYQFIYR